MLEYYWIIAIIIASIIIGTCCVHACNSVSVHGELNESLIAPDRKDDSKSIIDIESLEYAPDVTRSARSYHVHQRNYSASSDKSSNGSCGSACS